MLDKLRKKVVALKKVMRRESPRARPPQHKVVPRAFGSAIEAARHYEEAGQWGMAASTWKEHVEKGGCASASHISDTVELAYAMVKAFEQTGAQNPLGRHPVKKLVEEVITAGNCSGTP